MKRINYILSFFIAFTLIACSPEEKDLFDDSSANRIEASLAQVNEVLLHRESTYKKCLREE